MKPCSGMVHRVLVPWANGCTWWTNGWWINVFTVLQCAEELYHRSDSNQVLTTLPMTMSSFCGINFKNTIRKATV